MKEDPREAMLVQIATLCASIAATYRSADELVKFANQLDGKPTAESMRDVARRQRVRILEMEAQLAVLNATFTERFGTEL